LNLAIYPEYHNRDKAASFINKYGIYCYISNAKQLSSQWKNSYSDVRKVRQDMLNIYGMLMTFITVRALFITSSKGQAALLQGRFATPEGASSLKTSKQWHN